MTHRDPRHYEDPETFHPGRWTEEMESNLPKYAYFPFGGGPRLCIGMGFAMTEARLILATIARRFRLEPEPGREEVRPQPSITLRPKGGIRMRVSERGS